MFPKIVVPLNLGVSIINHPFWAPLCLETPIFVHPNKFLPITCGKDPCRGIRERKHVDHGCFKMPPKASWSKEENHDVFRFLRHSSKNECLLCSSAEFLRQQFDLIGENEVGTFLWCPQINDYFEIMVTLVLFGVFFCKANLPKNCLDKNPKMAIFLSFREFFRSTALLGPLLVMSSWLPVVMIGSVCSVRRSRGLGSRVERSGHSCHSCHSCWMVWREIQLKKSWDV